MLLFYDARKAFPLLQRDNALVCLQQALHSALDGTLSIRIETMHVGERNVEDIGHGMRAIFECYRTKPASEAFCETHCRYVDFQLVVAGQERFFVGEAEDCAVRAPYDEERDLIVYEPPNMQASPQFITLCPRSLAVFFPNDVHAGGLHVQGENGDIVHKCVIKVPVGLLQLGF